MKVVVDPDLCCGCGPCEETCPEVFKIEGDIAKVLVDVVPPENEEACRDAKDKCPTGAISIEE